MKARVIVTQPATRDTILLKQILTRYAGCKSGTWSSILERERIIFAEVALKQREMCEILSRLSVTSSYHRRRFIPRNVVTAVSQRESANVLSVSRLSQSAMHVQPRRAFLQKSPVDFLSTLFHVQRTNKQRIRRPSKCESDVFRFSPMNTLKDICAAYIFPRSYAPTTSTRIRQPDSQRPRANSLRRSSENCVHRVT